MKRDEREVGAASQIGGEPAGRCAESRGTVGDAPRLLQEKRTWGGYVWIYLPSHPDASGGFVPLHRLVVEAAIGGRLPRGCEVHHRDLNPRNNDLQNLLLLPAALHDALHISMGRHVRGAAASCDQWAARPFEELRAHYEKARLAPPSVWRAPDQQDSNEDA